MDQLLFYSVDYENEAPPRPLTPFESIMENTILVCFAVLLCGFCMYCLFLVWKDREGGRIEWSTGEVDQDFSHRSLDIEESVQAQNFGHLSLNIEELVQEYRRSSHLEPASSDIKELDPADQKLERALARLPAISIFEMDKLETPSGKDCVICLEDFEPGGQCQKFPICNHIFHFHCIRQWLRIQFNCPICRTSIWKSARKPKKRRNNRKRNQLVTS